MRLKQADPAALVVALATGVLKVRGEVHIFADGERLRADHPVVRAYPQLFVSADLPDRGIAEARHAHRVKARGIAA